MARSFLGWEDEADQTPPEADIKTIAVEAPTKCETCGHEPMAKGPRAISMIEVEAEKERREGIHAAALEGCARVCKKKDLDYWKGCWRGAAFVTVTVFIGIAVAFLLGWARV